MSTSIRLFCLVYGEPSSRAFEVEIERWKTISALKETIKEKIPDDLTGIAFNKLDLYKVEITVNKKDRRPQRPVFKDEDELSPMDKVGEEFPEVVDQRVHVLIKIPLANPLTKRPAPFEILDAEREAFRSRKKAKTGWVRRGQSMIYDPINFKHFPQHDKANFGRLRLDSELAYFDRTRYILLIENTKAMALVFLRPRRFGKSLTVSMLECFHGVQYQDQYTAYFDSLDIDKEVKAEKIFPNKWLVLKFDFSTANRTIIPEVAEQFLRDCINDHIKSFCETYHKYLGYETSERLINLVINVENAISSLNECVRIIRGALYTANTQDINNPLRGVQGIYVMVDEYDSFSNEYITTKIMDDLKGDDNESEFKTQPHESLFRTFWACLKKMVNQIGKQEEGLFKIYITGVSPLSLVDYTSGFNIQTNLSFEKEFAGFCGLTQAEVEVALQVIFEKNRDVEINDAVAECSEIAKRNYSGYHFCCRETVPTVFNTNTCLEYLQRLNLNGKGFPERSSNVAVADHMLQVLSKSPTVYNVLTRTFNSRPKLVGAPEWNFGVKYDQISNEFHTRDLREKLRNSEPAWLGLMLYLGGFTYDPKEPHKMLRIPNTVAAHDFAKYILDEYVGPKDRVQAAFQTLASTGDILPALRHLQKLTCQLDIHPNDFEYGEEAHRTRFYHMINLYPHLLESFPEFQLDQNRERIDLVIHRRTQPAMYIVTEWKCLQIGFLDIQINRGGKHPTLLKAEALDKMSIDEVLSIKFVHYDKHHPPEKTIEDWIRGRERVGRWAAPVEQLGHYLQSLNRDNQDIRAYLIVVVGARKIVLWEMDVQKPGSLYGQPSLADLVEDLPDSMENCTIASR